MVDLRALKNLISPKKEVDKKFFLDFLDADKQAAYEDEHVQAVMTLLRVLYLKKLKDRLKEAAEEREKLTKSEDYNAEKYREVLGLNAEISGIRAKMQIYRPFFGEPYFARMDLTDDKEGYNSYYIGKHGSEGLEILDWRAPLAQKYYQKSRTSFAINDYNYKLILRRAIRAENGKIKEFKNEYLSLSDYLSKEEIGDGNEELIFDPFLKEILKSRKEKSEITDIIRTIQEKQFEIITLPEQEEFVLQGVAGSGKTMILLHRLSYIMYNNESVRPSDVMVVTPSDSFNAFIDELSAVLELEKVRTSTLDSYYLKLLKSVGLDLSGKIDFSFKPCGAFLGYIYSPAFEADIDKKLAKIYDGVYGLFASDDCREVAETVLNSCAAQTDSYERIKNSSVRIRRCVLGEIKEKKDGGLYYTKQFRYMFNHVQEVKEFLSLVNSDDRMKGYAYFYRQLLSFYKSLKYLRRYSAKICACASDDLSALAAAVDKEIADLKRYKIKTAEGEVLTYAEGIEKRELLKKEIESVISAVSEISDGFLTLYDFADVVRSENYLTAIGKCEDTADVLRFFYKETVRAAKSKMNVPARPLSGCDLFALCFLLVKLGFDMSPKFSFVFVDEAQDISPAEYKVLRAVNDRAVFNIFGDLKQNITPYRGIADWAELGYKIYYLDLNYRNTTQIVEFVSGRLGIKMRSIGYGAEEVEVIPSRSVTSWLSSKNGLKAVICGGQSLEKYSRKVYNRLGETGKISKTKINVMTVYESKGLEFTAVAVADGDLTDNEKYIAYTRALKELAVIKD